MRSRQLTALGAAAALALGTAACGSSSSGGGGNSNASSGGGGGATINGAGSTFEAPVLMQWGNDLKSQGVTVNYQAVGSGAGVMQFMQGAVDFAGSDPSLKDAEIAAAKSKGEPVHIPTVLGAINISYNLPGAPKGLKLDGQTAADLFLGKVKTWNDPEIAKQNPGAKLPSTNVTVIHRSDSSGTTKGFTTFLAAYSPKWKSQVGTDKTVKWPAGTGAKGNAGVAAAVKQQPGAVGYVEQAYALQNNFTSASVKNKAGSYVEPTLQSTSAAGEGLKLPSDLRYTAINAPGAQAYPIVSQTFIIAYKDLCKAGVKQPAAKALVKFLTYGLSPAGQKSAQQLQFAPLPSPLLSKAQANVKSLECNGSPLG